MVYNHILKAGWITSSKSLYKYMLMSILQSWCLAYCRRGLLSIRRGLSFSDHCAWSPLLQLVIVTHRTRPHSSPINSTRDEGKSRGWSILLAQTFEWQNLMFDEESEGVATSVDTILTGTLPYEAAAAAKWSHGEEIKFLIESQDENEFQMLREYHFERHGKAA